MENCPVCFRFHRIRLHPHAANYSLIRRDGTTVVTRPLELVDGRMQGGAMYALERGLNMKWLGIIFAVFAAFASFGIGCATQVNAIAEICETNFHIPKIAVGIAVGALTAAVIFGGIKSIAKVCEKLVPFMAIFYVLGCIIILYKNYDYIIPAVTVICRLAFTPGAAVGGLVGGGIRSEEHTSELQSR